MADLFTSALADTQGQGFAFDAPAELARASTNFPREAGFGISEVVEESVISAEGDNEDDEPTDRLVSEGDIACGVHMAERWREEDPQTWLPARQSSGKRSRPTPPPHQPKKRNVDMEKLLAIAPVKPSVSTLVQCVFVTPHTAHAKQATELQVPIPLWCQYSVSKGKTKFQDDKFLSVSTDEHWLVRLVDSLTNQSVRTLAKKFVDSFRREFNAAVEIARTPRAIAGFEFEENPVEEKAKPRFKSNELPSIITVEILERTLVVVNSKQRILLKLDDATQNFISSVMVPVLREMIEETGEVSTSEMECSPDTKSNPCAFQLGANHTPNLRGKVIWNVAQHAWGITVKKPLAVPRRCFAVDPGLDAAEFAEQKVAMYWEAVNQWNRCDGSKRFRVPVPSDVKVSTSPSHA